MEPVSKKEIRSDKKYVTSVILAGVFGVVGIHHFYVERWGMGLLDFSLFVATVIFYVFGNPLVGVGLFAIDFVHTVIVTYLLLVGQYRDGKGKLITYPGQKI